MLVNSDLIGVAMEGRADNDFTCEELLNGINKLKIMMYLRASEDYPILNSAQEIWLTKEDEERQDLYEKFKPADSNCIFFTSKDEVSFEQRISIAQKYIDDARYAVITRFIQLLISSIGTAVEDYIIKNIPRVNNKDLNEAFYRKSTIFSPELYDKFGKLFKFNNPDVSYRLKDNEFIIVDCNSPPVFVVMGDSLIVSKDEDKTEVTAQLKLRFNLEGIALCLTESIKG